MLDKQDLLAIKELIDTSENRMAAKIDASENRTHAYIEGAVIPQLQLLAEGHQTLLETLAPKNRVEALEDEVVFMKSVIKALAQDVAELKKAQQAKRRPRCARPEAARRKPTPNHQGDRLLF